MRSLTIAVLALSTAAVFAAWVSHDMTQAMEALVVYDQERGREIDLVILQRNTFLPYFEARIEDVAAGRLTLAEASRLTLHFAEVNHPRFVQNLIELEAGETLREKLAQHHPLVRAGGALAHRLDRGRRLPHAHRAPTGRTYRRRSGAVMTLSPLAA